MVSSIQAQDTILYKYNNQVLVTTRRVVLGQESWPLESIKAVESEPSSNHINWSELPNARRIRNYTSEAWQGKIALPAFLWIVGLLLVMFAPISGLQPVLIGVGVILIGLAAFLMVRVWNSPSEVFKVRLVLKSTLGGLYQYEPIYFWEYKPPAQKTIAAIQKVLAYGRPEQ